MCTCEASLLKGPGQSVGDAKLLNAGCVRSAFSCSHLSGKAGQRGNQGEKTTQEGSLIGGDI